MISLCLLLLLAACTPALEKFAVDEVEKIAEAAEQDLEEELIKERDPSTSKERHRWL